MIGEVQNGAFSVGFCLQSWSWNISVMSCSLSYLGHEVWLLLLLVFYLQVFKHWLQLIGNYDD